MLTFTSYDDLSKLSPENPARPIIQKQLESLITEAGLFGQEYQTSHDGIVLLADREDLDKELDLFDPPRKLEDVFWEGTHIDGNYFVAIFVPNNQFTLTCVIENADWLPKNLRRALCACLVPNAI